MAANLYQVLSGSTVVLAFRADFAQASSPS